MVFWFRPCQRKPRWRKRRLSRAALQLLGLIALLAVLAGLLFLAPHWLLVAAVILLSGCLCFLIQK